MLNLIHQKRMEKARVLLSSNNIKRKRMKPYEDTGDPVGSYIDMSNEIENLNNISNLFQKNTYELFKQNQISANRFIQIVSEQDYEDFNNIFPYLKNIYSNQSNLNTLLVMEQAERLIQDAKKIQYKPKPKLRIVDRLKPNPPPSSPRPTRPRIRRPKKDPYEEQTPLTSISAEHTDPDKNNNVICYACNSKIKIDNYANHKKSLKHKVADKITADNIERQHNERQSYLNQLRHNYEVKDNRRQYTNTINNPVMREYFQNNLNQEYNEDNEDY
jgi:uncharacterized protein YnzC (UPF0291/DUF896 family)